MQKKYMKKEREDAPKPSPGDLSFDSYTLYFKGLRKWQRETGFGTGFGVAICREDDRDNLLFQMKGPLDETVLSIWEADIMALKIGLTKALNLGINHISICFDDPELFEFAMGRRSAPKNEKIASLMDDVQRIRQGFVTSIPLLVTDSQTKFVCDLAMETIVSDVSVPTTPRAAGAEKMFCVDSCLHKFFVEYMKQHIELRLNQGRVPRCPHVGCTSSLDLRSCAHLLTPKLKVLWEQRFKEESVPVCDRFHCPNPTCWALMSKTELTESSEDGVRRSCYECRKPFCINCKVLWHSNLSCDEYKKRSLGRKSSTTMWRQCRSCQHMNKLSQERIVVTCRCGYRFCYKCGSEWKSGGCSHRILLLRDMLVAGEEFDLDRPTDRFVCISQAIEDIQQGKMVIVVDDEDRKTIEI
ncbi:PREDICTED: uncharacterized protein LOC104783798 [Camelina sativa]|uniref:RBR-type E3 ubiquitin transferase n=1 Tax=Camelina sativa TaxID=90675 RepID=A0ABM0YX39_CAMSA|nr:PREDICTED: uncharacterized protein LOC104783798 [Camelina sativa]